MSQLAESDANNTAIRPQIAKSEPKVNDTAIIPKVVRICVFGATGVGKSTLCNFICNQDVFEAADGPNSCTKEPKTFSFDHNINGEVIQFEITDTPGWFDVNLSNKGSRFLSPFVMIQKINECIEIAKNGITAFFIVVPYERLHMDIEQSLYFMQDCFDSQQLRHVYMIFTKCKRRNAMEILDIFKQQKEQGERAAALLYNYSQTINEQCFATECEYNEEKELITKRRTILNEMNALYEQCGVAPAGIFHEAQKHYQTQLKDIVRQQRKKVILYGFTMLAAGSCVAIKVYMKYRMLFTNYSSLKRDHASLKSDHTSLKSDHTSLKSYHTSLKSDHTSLKSDHTSLKNKHSVLETEHSSLESDHSYYKYAAGVAEITIGVAGLIFEPFTSTAVIADGVRRLNE